MKLVKLLSLIILILFIGNIAVSNRSLDDSKKTVELTNEVNKLSHELAILRSQLAEATSLTQVAARVEDAGFNQFPKIVTLSGASQVASR